MYHAAHADERFRRTASTTCVEAATAVFLEQGYRRTQMADVADAHGRRQGHRSTSTSRARRRSSTRWCVTRTRPSRSSCRTRCRSRRPPPGATLEEVRKRVAGDRHCPCSPRRWRGGASATFGAELEAIVRELYRLSSSSHRVGIKLLDRCSHRSSGARGGLVRHGPRGRPRAADAATSRTASAAGACARRRGSRRHRPHRARDGRSSGRSTATGTRRPRPSTSRPPRTPSSSSSCAPCSNAA